MKPHRSAIGLYQAIKHYRTGAEVMLALKLGLLQCDAYCLHDKFHGSFYAGHNQARTFNTELGHFNIHGKVYISTSEDRFVPVELIHED